MTKWHDSILEDAYDLLDQEMAETHPEHGEYDVLKLARDAVEDADMALEKLSLLRRAGRLERQIERRVTRAASCDTHPKGGDVKQAPSQMSGAIDAEGSETPNLQHPHQDTSGVSNNG